MAPTIVAVIDITNVIIFLSIGDNNKLLIQKIVGI